MKATAGPQRASSARRSRTALSGRLRARREEIEQAALARVAAIADPGEPDNPTYAEGLKAAVAAALDYGFAAIECGEEGAPPPPPVLLVQARIAARSGVGLDTVLRRYFAGYSLLGDFLVEEAQRARLHPQALGRLLRVQAALFDRLLAAVSEEHGRETIERPGDSEQRRAERVRRLLDGESLEAPELAYDFKAHHVAVVAVGSDVGKLLRELAAALDRGLLLVNAREGESWAWLGGRRALEPSELCAQIQPQMLGRAAVAIGEPARGLAGWRLSHRQARAALAIAARRPGEPVRYAEVAMLASVLRDDLLVASLRRLYLEPLEAERDGGEAARETLRAYFSAGQNVSSAAAALGLNRNTVAARLRAIEQSLGCRLESCGPELEVALRLQEIPPLMPRAVR